MQYPSHEQALARAGLDIVYDPAVPLERINVTRGKQMQARLEPLDPDLIDRYAEMFNDGGEPPPLLLWKHGRGLLVPLDGNQRLAANAQAKPGKRRKEFSAYIVETDDQMVADRLCWTFNNLVNGKRMSYDECLQHGIVWHRKYGQPIPQAAKEWGLKLWELQARIVELEMRDLAGAANVELPKDCGTTLNVLSGLRKLGDDVALEAVKATALNGIGLDEVRQLVKDVRSAATHKDKMQAIKDFSAKPATRQSRAETKGGKVRLPKHRLPRERLQRLLDDAERLLGEFKDEAAFRPVGKEAKAQYFDTALIVANALIRVYGLGSILIGQGREGAA
jgi:hypothetical protein